MLGALVLLGPELRAQEGTADQKEMVWRIYWDGRKEPGVEAPVGDFSASGFDSLRLRERRPRVEKYAHDKDKDWREKCILY